MNKFLIANFNVGVIKYTKCILFWFWFPVTCWLSYVSVCLCPTSLYNRIPQYPWTFVRKTSTITRLLPLYSLHHHSFYPSSKRNASLHSYVWMLVQSLLYWSASTYERHGDQSYVLGFISWWLIYSRDFFCQKWTPTPIYFPRIVRNPISLN